MDDVETATVDVVVTDPAWIARRDQAIAALSRVTLWAHGPRERTAGQAGSL